MEFPAHIVFSCLLVCQPAIFVDSKRDGTGAAHGRKGFRMKRAELDRRIANGETLDDIVPALMDDGADITSYDDLKRFAIEKIESDELYLAEHVLKACLDVADYYGYDYSMGTLEKPTAIDGTDGRGCARCRLRPYRTALRRGACGESLCSLKTRRSAAGQSTE